MKAMTRTLYRRKERYCHLKQRRLNRTTFVHLYTQQTPQMETESSLELIRAGVVSTPLVLDDVLINDDLALEGGKTDGNRELDLTRVLKLVVISSVNFKPVGVGALHFKLLDTDAMIVDNDGLPPFARVCLDTILDVATGRTIDKFIVNVDDTSAEILEFFERILAKIDLVRNTTRALINDLHNDALLVVSHIQTTTALSCLRPVPIVICSDHQRRGSIAIE